MTVGLIKALITLMFAVVSPKVAETSLFRSKFSHHRLQDEFDNSKVVVSRNASRA